LPLASAVKMYKAWGIICNSFFLAGSFMSSSFKN
jgi:hypothetical protein